MQLQFCDWKAWRGLFLWLILLHLYLLDFPFKSVVVTYLYCQDETLSERMSQSCEWRAKETKQKQDFTFKSEFFFTVMN